MALLQQEQRATIHLSDGRLIAEVGDGGVFTTDGRHIGWLSQQQIYNRDGKLVLANRADLTEPPPSEGTAAEDAAAQRPAVQGAAAEEAAPGPQPRKPETHVVSRAARDTMRIMPQLSADWAEASGLEFLRAEAVPRQDEEEPPWLWRSTRYQVEGELARGAMGVVYQAYDRLGRRMVALKRVSLEGRQVPRGQIDPKLLRAVERGALDSGSFIEMREQLSEIDHQRLALAREFRILAALRHPHIVSVLDYGFDQRGRTYLVMELLEGAHTLVDASDVYALPQRIELLGQLIQALRYLHRMGVVHRDLKPENVLLMELAGVPIVKLIDFGLAMWMRRRGSRSAPAGTVGYMAPELLRGGAPSESTDIYALGVVAYELCAGHHPFEYLGNTDAMIAAARYGLADLDALPLEPAARELIGAMMSPKPEERPADAEEVLARWCAANNLAVPSARPVRDSLLRAARFVGRSHELRMLTDALDEAQQGHGSAWLLSGMSGVGKSRLLDEIRGAALVRGMLVLRGQATDTDAQSFALWRNVLRELVLYVPLDPLEAGVLKEQVRDLDELLDSPIKSVPPLDRAGHLWRLMKVVQAVFARLQVQTLLVLDDLHWATPESLALFKRVVDGVAQRRLMVVGTVRSEERPAWLYGLEALELQLETFDEDAIAELCEAVIGSEAARPETVRHVQRSSGGNAFWVMEFLRSLTEEQLEPDELLAAIEGGALPSTPSALLEARLARVPEQARGPLMLAAVAGRQLDLLLISTLVDDVPGWLRQCAGASVIELVDNVWRFRHDKLREQLLMQLDEEARRSLHGYVADMLQRGHKGRCPEAVMAYHRHAAGQLQAALPHLLDAAEGALAQGALTQAHELADKVLSCTDRLQMSLHDRARARLVLIDTSQALSRPEHAIEQTYKLLSEVGMSDTLHSPESQVVNAEQLLRSLWAKPRVLDQSQHPQEVWLLVCKAANICCRVQILLGRTEQAIHLLLLIHNLSRSLGLVAWAAAARCGLAYVMAQTPLRSLAHRVMTAACRVIETHGDDVAMATMHETNGLLCLCEGRWRQASHHMREVETFAAGIGDERRLLFALMQGSLALQARGRLLAAQAKLGEVKSAAAAEDDHQLFTQSLHRSGWLGLHLGRLEQAQEVFDRALRGEPSHLVKVGLMAGLALVSWLWGTEQGGAPGLDAAERMALEALELATRRRMGGHAGLFGVPALAWVLLEAYRHRPSHARVQVARYALHNLRQFTRQFPGMAPSYWLQRGRYAMAMGRHARARRALDKSMHLAMSLDMPLDRAMAAIEWARLAKDDAAAQQRGIDARRALRERGALGCLRLACGDETIWDGAFG